MNIRVWVRVLAFAAAGVSVFSSAPVGTAQAATTEPVQIRTDYSEAEAVLGILDNRAAGQEIVVADWERLFATEPYQRLQKREAAMRRTFTDDEFKKFVLSDELLAQRTELQQTLTSWRQMDLRKAAERILPYLPKDAVIRTKVFVLIKPLHNSFVFDVETDPAIFLFLDPSVSAASFENTVAHEMHHIGLSSGDKAYDARIKALPAAANKAAEWMGAFGEGEAILAAAGGPDADPQATAAAELKENWARGKREFNTDLKKVDQFFLDVLSGKLQGNAINEAGSEFFGLQGPWYTVGYRMAVVVELRYGRAALIECMLDRRLLLARYNQAAKAWNASHGANEQLATWSAEILRAVQSPN